LVSLAVVVGLGISPGVLRQGCDVCDVLRAVRAVVEHVVPKAGIDAGVVSVCCVEKSKSATCINNTPPQKALVSLSNSSNDQANMVCITQELVVLGFLETPNDKETKARTPTTADYYAFLHWVTGHCACAAGRPVLSAARPRFGTCDRALLFQPCPRAWNPAAQPKKSDDANSCPRANRQSLECGHAPSMT